MTHNDDTATLARQLCNAARLFARRGMCPATSGNFSARIDAHRVWISPSGGDKGELTDDALLQVSIDDAKVLGAGTPSSDTQLHLALYRGDAATGAVLHGHSIASTLLSRVGNPDEIVFQGYEMQKAIRGNTGPANPLALPVLPGSQDTAEQAERLRARQADAPFPYAFLVRGHGIYAWGADIDEARRHLEGWEFLLECERQRRLLEAAT